MALTKQFYLIQLEQVVNGDSPIATYYRVPDLAAIKRIYAIRIEPDKKIAAIFSDNHAAIEADSRFTKLTPTTIRQYIDADRRTLLERINEYGIC